MVWRVARGLGPGSGRRHRRRLGRRRGQVGRFAGELLDLGGCHHLDGRGRVVGDGRLEQLERAVSRERAGRLERLLADLDPLGALGPSVGGRDGGQVFGAADRRDQRERDRGHGEVVRGEGGPRCDQRWLACAVQGLEGRARHQRLRIGAQRLEQRNRVFGGEVRGGGGGRLAVEEVVARGGLRRELDPVLEAEAHSASERDSADARRGVAQAGADRGLVLGAGVGRGRHHRDQRPERRVSHVVIAGTHRTRARAAERRQTRDGPQSPEHAGCSRGDVGVALAAEDVPQDRDPGRVVTFQAAQAAHREQPHHRIARGDCGADEVREPARQRHLSQGVGGAPRNLGRLVLEPGHDPPQERRAQLVRQLCLGRHPPPPQTHGGQQGLAADLDGPVVQRGDDQLDRRQVVRSARLGEGVERFAAESGWPFGGHDRLEGRHRRRVAELSQGEHQLVADGEVLLGREPLDQERGEAGVADAPDGLRAAGANRGVLDSQQVAPPGGVGLAQVFLGEDLRQGVPGGRGRAQGGGEREGSEQRAHGGPPGRGRTIPPRSGSCLTLAPVTADATTQSRIRANWARTLTAAGFDPDCEDTLATLRPPSDPPAVGADDVVTLADPSAAPRSSAGGALSVASASDLELGELLGEGGMGLVHRAHQPSLARDVAVKTLRPERAHHEAAFLAEAQITAALDHPNVVPVHALGRTDQGELYLAMKRVSGEPWSSLVRRDPPEASPSALRRHLDVLGRVVDAVAYAHDRGIVHRDLKPENVMVGAYGQVYVVDWGLALCLSDLEDAAARAALCKPAGTPAYMAPEQAAGEGELSAATDVYLLGAILYELLTGQPPHRGGTIVSTLFAAVQNHVFPLEPNWAAPSELVEIATRCLLTEPAARYESAAGLRVALERFLSGEAAREEAKRRIGAAEQILATLAPPEDLLAGGSGSPAYAPLLEAESHVQAALQGWPQSQAAAELRLRVAESLACTALGADDLALAGSFLERLEAWSDVSALRAELERRRRETDPELLIALDQARQRTAQAASAGLLAAAAATIWIGIVMRIESLPMARWDDDGHPAWAVVLVASVLAIPLQAALLGCVRWLEPGRRRVYSATQALVAAMFVLSLGAMIVGAWRSWGLTQGPWWALLFLLPLVLYRGTLGGLRDPRVRSLVDTDA